MGQFRLNCFSPPQFQLFTQVVSLLLRAGADPNARDNWSYTPLHEASIKGKNDVCVMLLQHGADPTLRYCGDMQRSCLAEAGI